MSQEFYAQMDSIASQTASEYAASASPKRHVECRCSDVIYVYLYQDGVHIQTQHVDIPASWMDRWPTDSTVRRRVRRYANIGSARITNVAA